MKLKISDNLQLPAEAVTQTFAILAKRGVGKTYTANVMAEEMLKATLQVVVVDPIGVWWGLRAAANGKDEGLAIVVMGGDHGDVPLESTGGELVADFVVDSGRSVVLDLSHFRKGEMIRFMTAFTETIYRRNRAPLHLMVDEADAFAPQKTMHGEGAERLLGAMEDIVRRGRARGLGCTLITQRAAVLNKNVLTQIEVLVCLRTIAPQDRDAVDAWINVHGTEEQRAELMASLPSLPIGEAWFWSPGWLDLFKRVKVRKRETFDSSATPKAGEKIATPKKLKPVDLDDLRAKMAATIEKAKAEDPKALQQELRRVTAQLEQMRQKATEDDKKMTMDAGDRELLEEARRFANGGFAAQLENARGYLERVIQQGHEQLACYAGVVKKYATAQSNLHKRIEVAPGVAPQQIQLPKSKSPAAQNGRVSQVQQRVLDALFWLESIGNRRPSTLQVGAIALIDSTGGYFSNVVGPLTSTGLVERGQGTLALTEAGRAVANAPERIASLADYHEMLRGRVRRARSAGSKTVEIMNALIDAGGDSLTGEQIGQAVGIDPTGGYFSNVIGPLSTLGIITRARGLVTPTDILFPPGLV